MEKTHGQIVDNAFFFCENRELCKDSLPLFFRKKR